MSAVRGSPRSGGGSRTVESRADRAEASVHRERGEWCGGSAMTERITSERSGRRPAAQQMARSMNGASVGGGGPGSGRPVRSSCSPWSSVCRSGVRRSGSGAAGHRIRRWATRRQGNRRRTGGRVYRRPHRGRRVRGSSTAEAVRAFGRCPSTRRPLPGTAGCCHRLAAVARAGAVAGHNRHPAASIASDDPRRGIRKRPLGPKVVGTLTRTALASRTESPR